MFLSLNINDFLVASTILWIKSNSDLHLCLSLFSMPSINKEATPWVGGGKLYTLQSSKINWMGSTNLELKFLKSFSVNMQLVFF